MSMLETCLLSEDGGALCLRPQQLQVILLREQIIGRVIQTLPIGNHSQHYSKTRDDATKNIINKIILARVIH